MFGFSKMLVEKNHFLKSLNDMKSEKKNIKENTNKNIVIFCLLFFLKINKKNIREKEKEKFILYCIYIILGSQSCIFIFYIFYIPVNLK